MKLKSLSIKNFRSFSEREVSIKFGNETNVIVGENNVGKSNILKALEVLGSFDGKTLAESDFYNGEIGREVLIAASLDANDDLLRQFVKQLLHKLPHKSMVDKIVQGIDKEIRLEYSSKRSRTIVKFLDFWLLDGHIFHSLDDGMGDYRGVHGEKIMDTYLAEKNPLPLGKFFANCLKEPPKKRISFDQNLSKPFIDYFSKSFRRFAEIRMCPSGGNEPVLESFDGRFLADVLSNLKNGKGTKKKKFKEIQEKFEEIFPNLMLDVIREPLSSPPDIVIEKKATSYEVPISSSGSAIGEILILITHLVYLSDMCFGVDMPELHLHPHAERLVMNFFKEKSVSNQFIVVTHSPVFIDPKKIENTTVVREREGETTAKQFELNTLDAEEKQKVERHLDEKARDLFFSRAVLLVEGPTETGALPVFASSCKKTFDRYGISIVEAGSQFFGILIKILEAFEFPYIVMCDKDAIMNIANRVPDTSEPVKTSAVFCSLNGKVEKNDLNTLKELEPKIATIKNKKGKDIDVYPDEYFEILKDIALKYDFYVLPSTFEGVLNQAGFAEILEEARKIGRSKVIQGRFIAEKITENGSASKIPACFIDVINKIVEKTAK